MWYGIGQMWQVLNRISFIILFYFSDPDTPLSISCPMVTPYFKSSLILPPSHWLLIFWYLMCLCMSVFIYLFMYVCMFISDVNENLL